MATEGGRRKREEKGPSVSSSEQVHPSELRIVLLGALGVGKSLTGNTILGGSVFESEYSITSECQKREGMVAGRRVAVVEVPDLFHAALTRDKTLAEKCLALCAPGPHAFLLVVRVGKLTTEEEDSLEAIRNVFGEAASKHTMILFSHRDELKGQTIQQHVEESGDDLKILLEKCGDRYHVLNNKNVSDRLQVTRLLEKIDRMVEENAGWYYTKNIYQETEGAIRLKEQQYKEEWIQREEELKQQHENELKERERRTEEELKIRFEDELFRRKQELEKRFQDEQLRREQELEKRFQDEQLRREQELEKRSEDKQTRTEQEMEKRFQDEQLRREQELEKRFEDEQTRTIQEMEKRFQDEQLRREQELEKRFQDEQLRREQELEKRSADEQTRTEQEMEKRFRVEQSRKEEELEKKFQDEFLRREQEIQNIFQNEILISREQEIEKRFQDALLRKEEELKKRYKEENLKTVEELKQKYEEKYKLPELEEKALKDMFEKEKETEKKADERRNSLEHPPNMAGDQSSERTKESSGRPEAPELRLVLLGDSGAEKSAVGNIILGREAFSSDPGSETMEIQKRKGLVEGWRVAVVDVPDLSSTNVSGHWRRRAIDQCVNLSAPGPHAFLLVLPLGGGAGEAWGSLERGVEMFGEEVWGYTMALFTGRGEEARGATAEECLRSRGEELRRLAGRCGKGCHVLDCEDMEDRAQVAALLEKIQTNLPYYNNSAYRNAESKINRKMEEILREKQEEKQREEDKHRRKYEKELENWEQKMQAEIREKEDKIREQEDRIAELEERLAGEGDRERIRTLEAELRRERAERERLEQEVDGLKREMEKERREREERHRRELEEIRRGYEERAREEAERDAECAEVFGRLDTETEAAAGGTTEGRRASAHRRRQTACCSIS